MFDIIVLLQWHPEEARQRPAPRDDHARGPIDDEKGTGPSVM